jgi:diguanylate cyclase (GGDEF)-like protein/PAS domain S-box-containing protein
MTDSPEAANPGCGADPPAQSGLDADVRWIERMPAGVAILVADVVRYANAAALQLLQADDPAQLVGRRVDEFIHPLDLHRTLARLRRAEEGGANPPTEVRMIGCRGAALTVAMASTPLATPAGVGALATFLDLTERAAMERRLRETDENFQRMMNTMQDVFYRTDAHGITRYVCPAVKNVLGYEVEEIIGLPAAAFYPDLRERDVLVAAIRERGFVHDFPGRMRRKDGVIIDISISTRALYDELGNFAGVEGIWRDISERKQMERQLEYLATYDSLTGVLNRRTVLGHLERLLSRSAPVSVLLMDLDHFKQVNDVHGHAACDHVLCQFTALIATEKRSRDYFGRLGGEEFLLILDNADVDEAARIAERLCSRVASAAIVAQGGQAVPLTVSIGLAQARQQDQRTSDLLERADRALYRAKNQGRNRVAQ